MKSYFTSFLGLFSCTNANTVDSINFPPDSDMSSHQELIAKKSEDKNIIGFAVISEKNTNEQHPVYIEKNGNGAEVAFIIHSLITDETLGFALLKLFFEENNDYFKKYWLGSIPDQYKGYGGDLIKDNKIYIEMIKNYNPDKFKHIGLVLTKMIIQYYQEICEAKVFLSGVRNTHSFWYQLGFRVTDRAHQHLNKTFARDAKNKKAQRKDFGRHDMHLPEAAREKWLNHIAKHPIEVPKEQLSDKKIKKPG